MLALVNTRLKKGGKVERLEYFAYESNPDPLEVCEEKLLGMGFRRAGGDSPGDGASFARVAHGAADGVEMTVHLRPADYRGKRIPPRGLDLVVGCCFADLFDPDGLARSLHELAPRGKLPLGISSNHVRGEDAA